MTTEISGCTLYSLRVSELCVTSVFPFEHSVCRSTSRNSSKSTEGINRSPVVTTGSETQTSKRIRRGGGVEGWRGESGKLDGNRLVSLSVIGVGSGERQSAE